MFTISIIASCVFLIVTVIYLCKKCYGNAAGAAILSFILFKISSVSSKRKNL